jgi:hypothetical protein
MVILPGYCVAGTVGNKLLAASAAPGGGGGGSGGGSKAVDLDKRTKLSVACKVRGSLFPTNCLPPLLSPATSPISLVSLALKL